jgi:hypothetical protein
VHYLVDKSNRIIDVDAGWDLAAAEHAPEGSGPMRQKIIGHPLEAFLAGDATKMFVRSALDAARLLGQPRRLPYRCDGPDERRRFEMVFTPLGDGQVKVEHVLLEAQPRLPSTKPAKVRPFAGWRCSQCLRVRPAGSMEWTDAAIDANAVAPNDVCPACAKGLFEFASPK